MTPTIDCLYIQVFQVLLAYELPVHLYIIYSMYQSIPLAHWYLANPPTLAIYADEIVQNVATIGITVLVNAQLEPFYDIV
jgi:hypothetical protein